MRPTRRRGPIASCARRGRSLTVHGQDLDEMSSANENPRRISPARAPALNSLPFLAQQALPGPQHGPPQQLLLGAVAVAVPMNAAKVTIKRRYFIRSSIFQFC